MAIGSLLEHQVDVVDQAWQLKVIRRGSLCLLIPTSRSTSTHERSLKATHSLKLVGRKCYNLDKGKNSRTGIYATLSTKQRLLSSSIAKVMLDAFSNIYSENTIIPFSVNRTSNCKASKYVANSLYTPSIQANPYANWGVSDNFP